MADVIAGIFPERRVVSFTHRQNRFVFFSMVSELIGRNDVVLDFGAGRGRRAEIGGPHLRAISNCKGRCGKVIGADVDTAVLENPVVDEAVLIAPDGAMPLPDESVDLIYSYATFEHVAQPEPVARELMRVLKPGGWICAWTPNKWGYVGIGARLVPNRFHAKLLRLFEPGGREEQDVFPTVYRMNTRREIRRLFAGLEDYTFTFNGQPSYNLGNGFVARFWMLYMALTPRSLGKSLMIFLRKPL